jgi:hypothetical protein
MARFSWGADLHSLAVPSVKRVFFAVISSFQNVVMASRDGLQDFDFRKAPKLFENLNNFLVRLLDEYS